jgi:hypothetical protein
MYLLLHTLMSVVERKTIQNKTKYADIGNLYCKTVSLFDLCPLQAASSTV